MKCSLPDVVVPPLSSALVVSDPVSPLGTFYPTSLLVDHESSLRTMVTDIRIGNNSQLASVMCVPSSLFAQLAPVPLRMDGIKTGLCIRVYASNMGNEPVTFRSVVLGSRRRSREKGDIVLGFGYMPVEYGRTTSITVRPQVSLAPSSLHVPPEVLAHFRVERLVQGRYLDLPELASVDAGMLSKDNLLGGGKICFSGTPRVAADTLVTIDVTNVSPSRDTRHFAAALLGRP